MAHSQDAINQAAGTAHNNAYFAAINQGKSTKEATRIAEQAQRDTVTLMKAASTSDVLRPHAPSVARSIMSVLKRGGR